MTPEQKAAYVIAMSAYVMARVAGMQAENALRIDRGDALAYPEEAFEKVAIESGIHHNAVISLFNS